MNAYFPILIIVSALVLFCCAVIISRFHHANADLEFRIRSLHARMASEEETLQQSLTDACPLYEVSRKGEDYDGNWCVFRYSFQGYELFKTLIKEFTDDDDEFNRILAEELCEKLNEK